MNLNPMTQLNGWVIMSVILIVTATYFGLRRLFVQPLVRVMLDREAYLAGAEGQRELAERLAAEADTKASAVVEKARQEADDLLRGSSERADSYRSDKLRAAAREASARLDEARGKLEAERVSAREGLRDDAIHCVETACTRLMRDVARQDVELAVDEALRSTAGRGPS